MSWAGDLAQHAVKSQAQISSSGSQLPKDREAGRVRGALEEEGVGVD